jgi:hypothetical protein
MRVVGLLPFVSDVAAEVDGWLLGVSFWSPLRPWSPILTSRRATCLDGTGPHLPPRQRRSRNGLVHTTRPSQRSG